MQNPVHVEQRNVISLKKMKYFLYGTIPLLFGFRILYTNFSSTTLFPQLNVQIKNGLQSAEMARTIKTFSTTTTTFATATSNRIVTNTTNSTATLEMLFGLCDNVSDSENLTLTRDVCEQIRCAVILRRSGGRLGNRMFMFASAYGLARTQNCRLHVHHSILRDLSDSFQLQTIDKRMWLSDIGYRKLTNIKKVDTVCSFLSYLVRPNAFENIELIGYWQSYLYFDAYREEIRDIFSARNDTLARVATYLTNITRNICPICEPLSPTTHRELRQTFRTRYNVTWVSIHIRRQDFRGNGYSSDTAYVYRAMAYFRRRYHYQRVRFLIASDDKEYCDQTFVQDEKRKKVFILPYHFSAADDLIALTMCHHSIVTGGTYGFWGAYLAGGEVIHDVKYQAVCAPADYYPPWFVLVGAPVQKFHPPAS